MASTRIRVFMLFSILLAVPFTANAITVDGNLTDLIAASGDANVGASGSESGSDAENNGFDITNMYLYFDVSSDTLYAGFETQETVGNGCINGAGLCAFLPDPIEFDNTEQVSMSLDVGTLSWAANDVQMLIIGDGGAGTGPDILQGSVVPSGVSISYAVSEANDGVEFAIVGLIASGTINSFSPTVPVDIAVRFSAGSGKNPGPEDEAFIATTLVPIPAAVWLLGAALFGVASLRRRRG